MTEQYRPNLGELCHGNARRDAVHIAVAPVIAGSDLRPGWPIGLGADGKAYTLHVQHIGIVDPFLPYNEFIREDQQFWLFLYPNTITDLRHVWSHPAFKAKLPEITNE